ncbi:MAG: orotidine-5'-phosphate decarboxylase [Candidatus Melainabacteria bacterium]|jgi:orotidine-5'-phosphate decarboxylase|nr:orotidine-5'-phosphate decarboxylase [Candidatus Melainabacteria bacterium]
MNEKIIVALDFPSKQVVESFINKFELGKDDSIAFVKLGMELFYAEGPEMIEYLKDKGLKVFLDLKVHDIPNTAAGAIRSLAKYGVDILNVHASGGIEMMRRANDALKSENASAKLIGVTQLTSTDEAMMNNELGIAGSVEDAVLRLASNCKAAGLDGIVSSPLEVPRIKAELGQEFLTVCPGVRLVTNSNDDQKRISTPEEAFANGCDYIVMGRAITQADDPASTFAKITNLIPS